MHKEVGDQFGEEVMWPYCLNYEINLTLRNNLLFVPMFYSFRLRSQSFEAFKQIRLQILPVLHTDTDSQ